jgi:hypothetical protein
MNRYQLIDEGSDLELYCDGAHRAAFAGETPTAVLNAIAEAQDRGQTSGLIYSGGERVAIELPEHPMGLPRNPLGPPPEDLIS